MAKLIILYGHPADPEAFEDYYANRHIPFAAGHMPGVRDAQNLKIAGTPDGADAPYYRISQLSYASLGELRAGVATDGGRSVLADLRNFATGGVTVLLADD